MAEELWDIYDAARRRTGRIARRGVPMARDEYHIVVHVWLRNSRGEYLLSRRTANKSFPLQWECTGGSALRGEESEAAARREVLEELGIDLGGRPGRLLCSVRREHESWPDFADVWLFDIDTPLAAIRFQPGETCAAMWTAPMHIEAMIARGACMGRDIYPYLDELFSGALINSGRRP